MISPAVEYRRSRIYASDKLHEGLDAWVNTVSGWWRRTSSSVTDFCREGERIVEAAESYRMLSVRELKQRILEKQMAYRRRSRGYDADIGSALSLLVEASERSLDLRPYPVQMAGAIAIYRGCLAEMATGEGKSLTVCFPAILAAWTGRPCHIVTVNDYLAGRDAEIMGPLYAQAGVSVGWVKNGMPPEERAENYMRDVVYLTSKEMVADFLRDRIQLGRFCSPQRRHVYRMAAADSKLNRSLVMRGLDTVFVDEADSVLIDEAVTPLIISRETENAPDAGVYQAAVGIAASLEQGRDYTTDVKYRDVHFTERGVERMRDMAQAMPGIWNATDRKMEMIHQAVAASIFYRWEQQYVMQDGRIVIVDEFTGRLMPDRKWRQGMHQAIEAKEGLEVTAPSETLARISFQRFFRLFRRVGGMTGTAKSASRELWQIYGLPVVTIPTHRPCLRQMIPDRVFADETTKFQAVVADVRELQREGCPVLIGTRSIRVSEQLGRLLREEGLTVNVLNAVHDAREAEIVAQAGERGNITIATNMAGRGTDITLASGVASLGGLYVIATERHESARIDRQLFGRCARQGDPGSAQAYISVGDELMVRFVPSSLRNILAQAIASRWPGSGFLAGNVVRLAQYGAEALAYRQRRNVLRMDAWFQESLAFSGASEF